MKIRLCNAVIVTMGILAGCDGAPTSFSENSYLVFGHFYGECFGETCVELFKIENGSLQEDTLDFYPTQNNLPHNTSYVPLSNEAFESVKHLFNLIPAGLFSEEAVVIGEPDAGDWGGFYLETNKNGKTEFWLIDKMKSNIPAYLHTFVDALDEAIQQLQ